MKIKHKTTNENKYEETTTIDLHAPGLGVTHIECGLVYHDCEGTTSL